jgi:hypothetical protein
MVGSPSRLQERASRAIGIAVDPAVDPAIRAYRWQRAQ